MVATFFRNLCEFSNSRFCDVRTFSPTIVNVVDKQLQVGIFVEYSQAGCELDSKTKFEGKGLIEVD